MDSKILYTNDSADIQCVAVKAIETIKGGAASSSDGVASRSAVQRTQLTTSADHVVFLLPHESLYSYLYIGAADGTLLALRFRVVLKELSVPGGGQTYEHRVALEAQSKVVFSAPPAELPPNPRSLKPRVRHERALSTGASLAPAAELESSSTAVDGAAAAAVALTEGVRFIDAPATLPYVFLLVHGRFVVHEDDTLQALDPDFTAGIGIDGASVLFVCAGEEQDMVSRQRRHAHTTAAGKASTSHTAAYAAAAMTDVPAVHYALLLDDWTVVLVECTKAAATRLAFVSGAGDGAESSSEGAVAEGPDAAASAASASSSATPSALRVHPHTSTMAWCGDVLLTGSPHYYCLYDTLHGTLLSQLDVSGLLGGCAPYTAFIRGAAVDPAKEGFDLAAESAEVCSNSTGSMSSSSSTSFSSEGESSDGTDTEDNTSSSSSSSSSSSASGRSASGKLRDRSRTPSGTAAGWPSALVFRLRSGRLHVCAGAGRTDLTAAPPLAPAFGSAEAVHSCPPFLLCQRSATGSSSTGTGGGGTAEEAQESPAASASGTSLFKASVAELRRASRRLSASLAESRRPARQCELALFSCLDGRAWASPELEPTSFMTVNIHSVRAFPLGLLGVSRHAVEALMWRPFAVQLEDQIESGHYARVLRFVSQSFRGSEAARRVVLRRVCQASAARAMARRRYRVAFYFYSLAETGVDGLLRLFPELQRPAMAPSRHLGGQQGGHADAAVGASLHLARDGSFDGGVDHVPTRQLSYASHAPYRALYRILISQFFSLVADDDDDVGASSHAQRSDGEAGAAAESDRVSASAGSGGDRGSPSTASTSAAAPDAAPALPHRKRASIEYALFCLFAMDGAAARRLHCTRDELLQFMVAVRTLLPDDCAGALTALGIAPPSVLTTMLMASAGDYEGAFVRCQEDGDVAAAVAVLAMYARTSAATAAGLERLYQLQLPWMLRLDPPRAVQLLTTPPRFPGERPGPAALLPVLMAAGGTVLLDYLSYLINAEGSQEPAVHHLYATHLVRTLRTLRVEWGLQGFASGELGAEGGAGSETGLVGHIRRALLSFLQCSSLYDKERVLAALVEADLHEEQCVVLESLADHIGVLTVLVYRMQDVQRAVRYCEAHYADDRAQANRWLPLTELLHEQQQQQPAEESSAAQEQEQQPGSLPSVSHGLPSLSEAPGRSASSPSAAQGQPWQSRQRQPAATPLASAPWLPSATPYGALRPQPAAVQVATLPSADCRRVAASEAAAMAMYTSAAPQGDEDGAVAPARVPAWHPVMRFNQYLHMLLHVLLVPPQGSRVALAEVVWLLSTHSSHMNPRLVLSSLPGDLPLLSIAPYLIRAFQRLELHRQLICVEAAAVQSALADAVRWHVSLQQRCLWVNDDRRCVVCGERVGEGGLVVVFPNLKPAHFRCHEDGTLDPERGVPYLYNVS